VEKNTPPLIFGEVLFDCFPDGREKLGGAPFNVAWNLQAFGLSPLFVSRIGEDGHGRSIREKMKSWDMDVSGLQIDRSHPTGKVMIQLHDGEPRFTILPDSAYDHIAPPAETPPVKPPFLYHGSLALRNEVSRSTLSLFKRHYRCPVFIDVNLRDPWWNSGQVMNLLEDAAWLKLNEDELKTLFPGQQNLDRCCSMLLDRFSLEAVFITRGSRGAAAWTRDNLFASVTPRGDITVIDTVGAGDAFSSVLLLGLTRGWPLQTILDRAQEFASAVVGQQGAVTENKAFYEPFTTRWKVP